MMCGWRDESRRRNFMGEHEQRAKTGEGRQLDIIREESKVRSARCFVHVSRN